MPDWVFTSSELKDVTITLRVLEEGAIARSPDGIVMGGNTRPHRVQSPSNPPQRNFGEHLRSRHNITRERLGGGDTHLEGLPTPNVRELIDRFEGGSRPVTRQRIGSGVLASGSEPVTGNIPHAGPALDLGRNLAANFDTVSYPEHLFQSAGSEGQIYQPQHLRTKPHYAPVVNIVRPLTPPPRPIPAPRLIPPPPPPPRRLPLSSPLGAIEERRPEALLPAAPRSPGSSTELSDVSSARSSSSFEWG